jgi:hypothetical protein
LDIDCGNLLSNLLQFTDQPSLLVENNDGLDFDLLRQTFGAAKSLEEVVNWRIRQEQDWTGQRTGMGKDRLLKDNMWHYAVLY